MDSFNRIPRHRPPQSALDRLHAKHEADAAWRSMCEAEPALETLVASLHGQRRSWDIFESAKQQAKRLAGWGARNPALRSSRAYEVAVEMVAREVAP